MLRYGINGRVVSNTETWLLGVSEVQQTRGNIGLNITAFWEA
jgi:hypothetical protein